jgi:hypothetical protein
VGWSSRNIGYASLGTGELKRTYNRTGTRQREEVVLLSISGARNSIIPLRRIRGKSEEPAGASSHSERKPSTGIESRERERARDGRAQSRVSFTFISRSDSAFYLPLALLYSLLLHSWDRKWIGSGSTIPLSPRRDTQEKGGKGGGGGGGVNDFHTLSTHVNGIALIP